MRLQKYLARHYGVANSKGKEGATDNVLVYGIGAGALFMAAQINNERRSSYRVTGFINTDKKRLKIRGLGVYDWDGDPAALESILVRRGVTHVLFTSNADFNRERDGLVDFCIANNIHMLMGGGIQPLERNKRLTRPIKPIEIEDLLFREPITIDEDNVAHEVDGRVVLVTGAAGSIGRGITRRLLGFAPRHLILLDMAETPLHDLELELGRDFPERNITFVLSDVRSKSKVVSVFNRWHPDLVFHAAAYKHVPVIESHPCEGVMTNIWGTINMAHCAIEGGAGKFVMISSDKAVNPTNVMGATKRIAELWVRGLRGNSSGTRFIITRFGNVLGSNGSVIPIFRDQIASGGPLTVTHPEMTRYFMTIPEACRLVLQAAAMGEGDEIFVFDMGQQVKIDNLARRMILLSGLVPDEDIMVEYTGLRPGEKLYEELLSEAEATAATQNEKIRIVMTDPVDVPRIKQDIVELVKAAARGDADASVRMMKRVIPEFKSINSPYETLDN
jgi:FlaA1/EpsC-like NDP-sugar epimerase